MKLDSSRLYKVYSRKILIVILFCSLFQVSFSQKTQTYSDLSRDYREALELFDKQKFVAAREKFSQVGKTLLETPYLTANEEVNLLRINAEYYMAMCALELFNDDAEELFLEFVNRYPKNPRSVLAFFQIGKFYFRQEKYPEALTWFEKVDEEDLSVSEYVEYKFKSGYTYFETGDLSRAKTSFGAIKELSNKYTYPSIYYYAYISYLQKDYATSLTHFLLLKDSKVYETIYPYYVANIYYYTGRYRELSEYAAEILQKDEIGNKTAFNNLAAKAYFQMQEYDKAVTFYEEFKRLDSTNTITNDDIYQLGYAYYRIDEYDKAIEQLQKLAEHENAYGQFALITLGDAFLQTADKQSARNAFGKASRMDFSEDQKSIALLNYAKLSYELNFDQAAIQSFRQFISSYPLAQEINEAKSILGEILLSTKNYKEALEVLEGIVPLNGNARLAYQKVSYYRGVELFNEKNLEDALVLFDKSLANAGDNTIQAMAHYWKGEALYNMGSYDQAIRNYQYFLNNPAAESISWFSNVYYSLGYAYFSKEDYKTASFYFEKYLKADKNELKLVNDAILRNADGNFVIRNYDKALFHYNKIINTGEKGADYALFQKGMILGLQNRINDKVVTLHTLLKEYRNSPYADDARYETANSYFILNNIQNALDDFNKVIKDFPASSYVPKAKLNIALIYYNKEEDEKAMLAYKGIVKEYPASEESQQALQAIRNIYIDKGNLDGYLDYIKNVPHATLSINMEDSVSYEAANNLFLKGDCEGSIKGFDRYLSKFPKGFFAAEAHFFRGECFLRMNEPGKALIDFEYLLSDKHTRFQEQALLNAARIQMKLQQPDKAIGHYKRVEETAEYKESYGEAILAIMKTYVQMQDYAQAVVYADKVLKYEKASAEDINIAHLILGKSYYAAGNTEEALKEFDIVIQSTKTEPGAEARYLKALILYERGDYLGSQEECFELSNQIPSFDYWIAKGFILLADNYTALGNMFQAKSTLQSVINEYGSDTDDIKTTARKKLEELEAQEKPKQN